MSRSTYSFDESVDEKLKDLAKNKGTNKTEILKRAIALYSFLEGRRAQAGSDGITVEFDPTNPQDRAEVVMP